LRKEFLFHINDLLEKDKDTTFFTVDMGMWAIERSLKNYPERCKNVGIFEDGLVSILAGHSRAGLTPILFGIQPFIIQRTLEQIKMDIAYQGLGINIVGTGAAIDYAKYGYSHYCAEDLILVKSIPGCQFIAPGNANEFISLFKQTYKNGKPTFFRISDHPNKGLVEEVTFGKANVIKKGNKGTIIVVSILLDLVIEAVDDLDVTILYYTTLEPFDNITLKNNNPTNKILIVEPQYEGSLLYDIYKSIPNTMLKINHVSFPREIFRNYGNYYEKMEYYGFTKEKIKQSILELINDN